MRFKSRRGSSLVYLGFSMVVFFISFGIVWMLVPTILGAFFSIINDLDIVTDQDWIDLHDNTETQIRTLIPISIAAGITLAFLKVLMVATNKGRD